jgi:hypothetical protein
MENNIDSRAELQYLLKSGPKKCAQSRRKKSAIRRLCLFHGVGQIREEIVIVELAETYSDIVTAARCNFFGVYRVILPAISFRFADSRNSF